MLPNYVGLKNGLRPLTAPAKVEGVNQASGWTFLTKPNGRDGRPTQFYLLNWKSAIQDINLNRGLLFMPGQVGDSDPSFITRVPLQTTYHAHLIINLNGFGGVFVRPIATQTKDIYLHALEDE